MSEITTTKLAVFKGKKIRKVVYKNEWWFSVVDVIAVLGISIDARNYWKVLKNRLEKEGSNQTVTNCNQLKLLAADGKLRKTDCASTETMLRIIQSVPSKRAEPLKLWLAKVGYERIQEIDDPELATKRTKEIYKAKGYPSVWIEKRMRGIAIREELTDEWRKREAKGEREYAILTAEISKATFGMTPSKYKKYKGLDKENLRDHMTDLELILNMLGEATTTKLTKDRDSMGFEKLKVDAQDGGSVAGRTRKDIEKQTGKRVVTKKNYLPKNTIKKLGSL
jgi:DNA-damage-inducible protein D